MGTGQSPSQPSIAQFPDSSPIISWTNRPRTLHQLQRFFPTPRRASRLETGQLITLMYMTKDLADQLRVLDASDDPQLTATTRAGLDLNRKYSLEALHPRHGRKRLVTVHLTFGAVRNNSLAMS